MEWFYKWFFIKVLIGFDRLSAVRWPINHRSCFWPIGSAWLVSALLASPQVNPLSEQLLADQEKLEWLLIHFILKLLDAAVACVPNRNFNNSWLSSGCCKVPSVSHFTSASPTDSTRRSGKSSFTPSSACLQCVTLCCSLSIVTSFFQLRHY